MKGREPSSGAGITDVLLTLAQNRIHISLKADGVTLILTPVSRVTQVIADMVRATKPALVEHLQSDPPLSRTWTGEAEQLLARVRDPDLHSLLDHEWKSALGDAWYRGIPGKEAAFIAFGALCVRLLLEAGDNWSAALRPPSAASEEPH